MNEGAALTITVCPEPARRYGNRLLLIQRDGRGAGAFGSIPNFQWLASRRAQLADKLYEIRRGLGHAGGRIDPTKGGAALAQLFSLGAQWVATLLGPDETKRSRELMMLFRTLVPDWARRDRSLRIEVRHSARGADLAAAIPFEILPLFDLTEPKRPETKADCALLALRFLGMSGVVARQPHTRVPAHFVLHRDADLGRVRVRAFCDWSLDGVAEEMAQFGDVNAHFHLDHAWPTESLTSELAARELVRRLFGSSDEEGAGRAQIHHFACHYGGRDAASNEEAFVFSAPVGIVRGARQTPIVISRDLLDECRLTLVAAGQSANHHDDGPLMVLNACNTGVFRLLEREPLVWWLLGAGYRAVLGTETRVPDRAAARFSRFLYAQLGRSITLGEAVTAARWEMLEKLNNPVGLFFTLHGRPELRLPPPRDRPYATTARMQSSEAADLKA